MVLWLSINSLNILKTSAKNLAFPFWLFNNNSLSLRLIDSSPSFIGESVCLSCTCVEWNWVRARFFCLKPNQSEESCLLLITKADIHWPADKQELTRVTEHLLYSQHLCPKICCIKCNTFMFTGPIHVIIIMTITGNIHVIMSDIYV